MSDQPKPTGVWTLVPRALHFNIMCGDTVIYEGVTSEKQGNALADAHNAALTAERERRKHELRELESEHELANGLLRGQLAAERSERCEVCNTELSQCGTQGVDGEPSLDCLVCKLRDQLTAEREKNDDWRNTERRVAKERDEARDQLDSERKHSAFCSKMANERLDQAVELKSQLAVERERSKWLEAIHGGTANECIAEFITPLREQLEAINAALADGRTNYELLCDDYRAIADSNQQLREQLATAVEALKVIRNGNVSDKVRQYIAAALANIVRPLMSNPTTTGEQIAQSLALDGYLYYEPDALTRANPVTVSHVAEVINAALAAERQKHRKEIEAVTMNTSDIKTVQQLREQLAAEREKVTLATQMVQIESKRANEAQQKVQTLVDALTRIRHRHRNSQDSVTWIIAQDELAKVAKCG